MNIPIVPIIGILFFLCFLIIIAKSCPAFKAMRRKRRKLIPIPRTKPDAQLFGDSKSQDDTTEHPDCVLLLEEVMEILWECLEKEAFISPDFVGDRRILEEKYRLWWLLRGKLEQRYQELSSSTPVTAPVFDPDIPF